MGSPYLSPIFSLIKRGFQIVAKINEFKHFYHNRGRRWDKYLKGKEPYRANQEELVTLVQDYLDRNVALIKTD